MGTLGLAEMEMEVDSSFANSDFGSTQARSAFQWGGTIFALGQFGCWVAFLAVASNLFFVKPFQFPVSSYLSLHLIGWRIDCEMTLPGILCLIIAILLILTEIRGIGELSL